MTSSIVLSDAFDFMRSLPSGSVDAIITDPPYGSTACKWDKKVDLLDLWKEFKRIAKPKAAMVIFGIQPFSSLLVASNPKMYRTEWIWSKNRPTNALLAKFQPLRAHEQIIVFGKPGINYYPQIWNSGLKKSVPGGGRISTAGNTERIGYESDGERYPTSLLYYPMSHGERGLHPTQKPLELMRYLIRTYSLPGQIIVDPFAGSGTTIVAAADLGRIGLGCDSDAHFATIAQNRLTGIQLAPSNADGLVQRTLWGSAS